MYNNPYFNQIPSIERINGQIQELEKMKTQIQQYNPVQQPSINQTFQLTPTHQSLMKYVNTIDDVDKEVVFGDTPFFSNDLSMLWIKNAKGEIKSYELQEIVVKDEKDIKIETLLENNNTLLDELENLKKELKTYEQSNNKYVDGTIENKKSSTSKSNPRNNKK